MAGGINLYGYVESSPTNKIDPFGEFAITGCVTVYYVLAATVTIGAWGQIEIWKRLRRCECPSLQYVWDSFTKFTKNSPDDSFDRNRADRAERKSNRNIDPKPGKNVSLPIDLENFKTKIGKGLDVAADILSNIFGIK